MFAEIFGFPMDPSLQKKRILLFQEGALRFLFIDVYENYLIPCRNQKLRVLVFF